MSFNHIVLQGRMVRDPELRRTGSGVPVTSFTLAVDRDIPNKETLIAKFLGSIQSPVYGLARALQAVADKQEAPAAE